MRSVILIFLSVGFLTGCSERASSYYWQHPQALHDALIKCQTHRNTATCENLSQIGYSMNILGQELQANPQDYGKILLNLQMELAEKSAQKQENTDESLQSLQQEIEQRLAVIKWLESPEK